MLDGAKRDKQSRTPNWERVLDMIDGVEIKYTRPIVTGNGTTYEAYRSDWAETGREIGHVIHVTLFEGKPSGWHCHETQTDSVFVVNGRIILGLYDDNDKSPTKGKLMVVRLDAIDPTLIVIPPLVWHGMKPLGGPASFLNIITHPFNYERPDELRLPVDTPQIPFDLVNAK